MPLTARLAGLCALLPSLLLAAPALSADFDGPYPSHPYAERPDPGRLYPDRAPVGPGYGPPPRRHGEDGDGPPRGDLALRRPHFTAGPPDACREFVRRRLDAYGEPVVRRVRVCEEPDFAGGPPRPPEDVPPRRWGGPRW